MASPDAIRDSIDTVVYLLRASLSPLVSSNQILAATPDEFGDYRDPSDPVVTVFMYRILTHPTMRNQPNRRLVNGSETRPLLPLELGLLITPWARDTRDEYRIMGRVLQTLYDYSELGPADLQGNSWEPNDSVQIILDTLPIEDHYRIWDTVELPYRLSLTYTMRVIGIEPSRTIEHPLIVSAEFRGPTNVS